MVKSLFFALWLSLAFAQSFQSHKRRVSLLGPSAVQSPTQLFSGQNKFPQFSSNRKTDTVSGVQASVSTSSDVSVLFPEVPGSDVNIQAARALLQRTPCYPELDNVNEMTDAQLLALHILDNNYVTRELISKHRQWHENPKNSIGGITGPGSGTVLGGMHSKMLKTYENWISPGWKRPGWNPSKSIPIQLSIDPKFSSLGQRLTNNPNYQEPFIFRGVDPDNGLSSNDFLTPDDWWRAQGLTNHASPHFAVGGPMLNSAISPADWSSFIGWHAHLQHQFERWLLSPNGITWRQNHPFHPLLQDGNIDVFDSPDSFQNDGICSVQSSAICLWLERKQNFVNPIG